MIRNSDLSGRSTLSEFLKNNLGTVHKFQGKEAGEVIFLLGCDNTATGAINWVNKNIINVAATRAKYRLYIIGNYQAWRSNKLFKRTKWTMNEKTKN